MIFVDTVAPPDGAQISEFDVVDGVVPFPGWEAFDESEIGDIDAATRERAAARALSVPARVPTDPILLRDERRFQIPVTLLSGLHDTDSYTAEISQRGRYADEWNAIRDREVVRLGSGHWPQFSMPDALATALIAAIDR